MAPDALDRKSPQRSDSAGEDPIELRCLEIWGGSAATSRAVRVPGLDMYVRSETHLGGSAGGDVYYVSQCGAGNIARLALADVAGHGEGASGVAQTLARLMRKHINTPDQTRLTREMNAEFDAFDRQGRFATALLATYFAPSSQLILVNAGHPPPLIYRAVAGEWSFVTSGVDSSVLTDSRLRDLPLGVIEPTVYSQIAVTLEAGDLVVCYTDALTEAESPAGVQLGTEGLLDMVRGVDLRGAGENGISPQGLTDALFERAAAHRHGREAGDDQSVIVLRHNGEPPAAQTLSEKVAVLGRMLGLLPTQISAGSD